MSRDVFNYYLYSPSGAKIKNPILEFKKISPTKYRVRVHGAKGGFPLVFSESFHEGWKGYLVKTEPAKVRIKADLANKVSSYRVLDGNDDDQANREELLDYISKGWVTELGDDEQKTIIHNKWENGERRLDYLEKYSIDFVSKNFQDTIQNDNLQNGAFYEAWFEKPLPEEEHLPVNGYANSWYIEVEKNCNEYSNKCIKNADGSYDMELVVEFEPQRLFYIGLFVSGMALFCCLVYLGYSFAKRRK